MFFIYSTGAAGAEAGASSGTTTAAGSLGFAGASGLVASTCLVTASLAGGGAIACYTKEHLAGMNVITVDDEVVGFCVCKVNLIDLIMIDHLRHGEGLGGRLLAHCETRLFEQYDELRLESFEKNVKANRFYEKHGWGTRGERYYDHASGVFKVLYVKEPD